MEIKVMNYNILHGFHGIEKHWTPEYDRLKAAPLKGSSKSC